MSVVQVAVEDDVLGVVAAVGVVGGDADLRHELLAVRAPQGSGSAARQQLEVER